MPRTRPAATALALIGCRPLSLLVSLAPAKQNCLSIQDTPLSTNNTHIVSPENAAAGALARAGAAGICLAVGELLALSHSRFWVTAC